MEYSGILQDIDAARLAQKGAARAGGADSKAQALYAEIQKLYTRLSEVETLNPNPQGVRETVITLQADVRELLNSLKQRPLKEDADDAHHQHLNTLISLIDSSIKRLREASTNEVDRMMARLSGRGELALKEAFLTAAAGYLERSDPSAFSEAVQNLLAPNFESLSNLRRQRDALEKEVGELRTRIETSNSLLRELGDAVEAQRKGAIGVAEEVNGKYAAIEGKMKGAFAELLVELDEKAKVQRDDAKLASDDVLIALKSSEVDARRIVQVVGTIGATGNYQRIADEEGKVADRWRVTTVSLFCLGIAIALLSFLYHLLWGSSANVAGWTFLLRFATAIVVASPAVYTARESARHRTMSDRARQKELELASLGPFTELMPEEKRVAIRERLVEKYFGGEVAAHEAAAPFTTLDEMAKFFERVMSASKSSNKPSN